MSDGGPAFPQLVIFEGRPVEAVDGMRLRDYFAAAALQGMCASGEKWAAAVQANGVSIHKMAYAHADAMLKARS